MAETPPATATRPQLIRILEAFVYKFSALRANIPSVVLQARSDGREHTSDADGAAAPGNAEDGPLVDRYTLHH